MHDDARPRIVGDVLTRGQWEGGPPETLKWLARLLRDEGTDLMTASSSELERGTPVYVDADADLNEVQRRMAMSHIRRIPVVDKGHLLGLIDLLDLAMLDPEDAVQVTEREE
ncbi:MAG: CBS domain-containing protein [Actinomycetota bacterium]|nr:CBS domain-containing protein [Actinomycetota bacterium]